MNTAEKIYREVQSLPDAQAREVLDFVGFLKSRYPSVPVARQAGVLKGTALVLDPDWSRPSDDITDEFYRA